MLNFVMSILSPHKVYEMIKLIPMSHLFYLIDYIINRKNFYCGLAVMDQAVATEVKKNRKQKSKMAKKRL